LILDMDQTLQPKIFASRCRFILIPSSRRAWANISPPLTRFFWGTWKLGAIVANRSVDIKQYLAFYKSKNLLFRCKKWCFELPGDDDGELGVFQGAARSDEVAVSDLPVPQKLGPFRPRRGSLVCPCNFKVGQWLVPSSGLKRRGSSTHPVKR
jgi:hypothetical protein